MSRTARRLTIEANRTNKVFNSVRSGLCEAIAHAKANAPARPPEPVLPREKITAEPLTPGA
jgi:hypothetical protein